MSLKSVTWKNDQILKFLDLLRCRPIIWDSTHPQFHNKFQRDLVVDEVSYQMDTTNEIIKRKMHIMRCQYRKECRKVKKTKGYKPVWQHFDRVKFMFKQEKKFKPEIITYKKILKPIKMEFLNIDDPLDSSNELEPDDNEDDMEHEHETIQHRDSGDLKDDFSIFGEHIANEMRLLNGYPEIQEGLRSQIILALKEAKLAILKAEKN